MKCLPHFLLSSCCLLALSACAVLPEAGRAPATAPRLSRAEAQTLGARLFPLAVQGLGGAIQDPALQDHLAELGRHLAPEGAGSGPSRRWVAVNDTTPRLLVFPGGFVAVSRGLLVELDSDAELAALLAHALGHHRARHPARDLPAELSAARLRGFLTNNGERSAFGPNARQAEELAAALGDMTFTRQQEEAADRLGLQALARAGYDPEGARRLWTLASRQLATKNAPRWRSGLLQHHPLSPERLAALRRQPAATALGAGARPNTDAFDRALAPLRRARQAYALVDRAAKAEKAGRLGEALGFYLQAAAAAPDETPILTALGMAYLRADDLNAARLNLAQAVRLDGRYYYSRLGLGYVYLQQGDLTRAVAELEKSLALRPTRRGGYLLAAGYEQSGRRRQAVALYRAVAGAEPPDALGRSAASRAAALEEER